MCWRWNAAVLPHESGEATAVPQLPLWQRRPHETPTLSKASSAVSGDEEQKDEQLFLELQQRRLPALQLPYVEPSLPRGADNLLLAARPGGRAPLLLVGTSCTSGGLTQRGDKKEKAHQVSLYDVEPQKLGGLSAEPFWSEQSRLLVALCWDHSGGCFAAASQEEDVKGEKVCYINIWSIHDGSERSVGRLVWPPIEQRWELRALCFCGFRLAALAKGTNCSFVSLMDVDTCLEVSRLILPPDYPRYVSQFLLSSPVEGLCMECLALAVDRRVLLWTPGQQDEEFVEVAYWSGCRSPLGTDITLGQDERNKLLVTQVKENGLAHEAGVRGSSGWLLAGWRPLRPSNGYFLHMPHTADSLKRMKDIEKNPEVMLRFQPPNLDIVTLEMDFHVRCTAPFEDGTLLAVGCLKIEDFESVTGLPRKSTPTQGHGKNHAESSMLSIWSLETREFWRAKEVHVTSSISALCWLSRSELVVQLDTEDAVGLVNIESGSLVRRWSCKPWKPKAMVARWCGFSAPQTLGAQDWPPWIAVGLQTGKSPPRSRVAVFAARGGGCVLPAAVISGAESKRKRKLPVVACNESSMIPQFLAVSGIDGTEPSEITFDGSTTASSDPLGKSVRGLSIWQLEDTRARKVCALSCHAQPTSVALSRNLLVACFHQSSILKAYRLLGDGLGCQELCCEDGADNLVAAAARAASDGAADVAAAAGKKSQSSQVVGLACWIRPGEVKKATLSWAKHAEVTALAFLPQRCHLAGLGAGVCCLWNLSTEGVVHCYHEVRVDGENLTCLAVGFDGQLRRVTEEPRAGSPPRARRPSNVGLLTSGEPLPTVQVATSGDSPRVTVVELRTEYRSVWELQDGERQGTRAASPRVLRFKESGRWLAVGDAAGQVHLFKLGRIGQGDGAKVAPAPTHQILSLSGEVVDLVLQGEQLLRATCWHPPLGPRQESDDKFGLEPEGDKVLVYDLMNPSLDFMLPDLHMKAEDTSSALQAQLELMPRLLHQRLPGLGWTLLHCCACRGQAQHARLLVRLSASPFELDAQGRNVLDFALQHNEFGVVEDLMTVLIQYPVTEPGHSWDHLHENSEVLGRALLANSLPSEHLALTRTVVRLLRFRTATLPEFLDSVCWGTPLPLEVTRAGEVQKPLPSRAALQENQMVIRSYTAPVYRPDMPDLEGLVPLSKDPQRPVEIRVWFLRGALDKEIGMIRALKESEQEEIMRTKFVQFLLEEQWTNLGWKQFRLELGLYIFSLICWACWCVAGRESCPPPATFGEENASGVAFWIFGVVLIILQVFFLLEELKQFCYELPRGERKGTWANLSVVMNYFSTWNNLDIVRIALVTTAVVRSMAGNREGIFVEEGTTIWEGRNLLAITTVFVCSRLVSFLRAGSSTGHLVRTLIIIFWDMSSFFWVMSVMLLTFVFAFQLLYDQPFTFEGLGATMWYVYMHGIFGDADDVVQQPRHDEPLWEPADNSGSLTARLLLVICVVVMLVVMMNFLIAIMSDSYDKVQESAEVARNVMRLELVYEAEVANIVRRCHRTAKWPPKAYVFTCQGVRYAGGGHQATQQENSRWEGRVRQVEKVVRRENRHTCQVLMEQAAQLETLDHRIHALESHVNQGHGRLQDTLERLVDQLKRLIPEPRAGALVERTQQTTPRRPSKGAIQPPSRSQKEDVSEGPREVGLVGLGQSLAFEAPKRWGE